MNPEGQPRVHSGRNRLVSLPRIKVAIIKSFLFRTQDIQVSIKNCCTRKKAESINSESTEKGKTQ